MKFRPLGRSGMQVSVLGLGTVKLGRNEALKYPRPFRIPDDHTVRHLLALAHELGINLLDTAPAYGHAEQRLGRLLTHRNDWILVSKVGETFSQGRSSFDYSAAAVRHSVEQSLRRLKTDYLDVVLIHSDGDDERILREEPVLEILQQMKQQGLIRAYGMSSKTLAGGLLVVENCDMVMASCNPAYQDELPVIAAAHKAGKGVLIKKALQSGYVSRQADVEKALQFVCSQAGVSSVVIGTIHAGHLRANVAALNDLPA
ncbi:MAG: aldo/keto reductase [gamma proteobacterium symbiont of Bathyaustriella thionipta]|nr:aldo/keto reductase [gamma proteobacterium symbiont of Bathyaustriella thionipta]